MGFELGNFHQFRHTFIILTNPMGEIAEAILTGSMCEMCRVYLINNAGNLLINEATCGTPAIFATIRK